MTDPPASQPDVHPEALAGPQLAHAALEAVIMVDDEQRIVMINPSGLAMFGLDQEQAMGMSLSQLVPERLRASHQLHFHRFRDSGQLERTMGQRSHVVGLRADGSEFPLEAAIFRSEVVQPWGTQTYYTALLRDLTELRRMTLVIDQLNQRLRSLFERVPAAIWITEAERVVFANPASAQLMGRANPSDLLGCSIFEFLSPSSHATVREHLQTLEQEDATVVISGAIRHADGSLREVELVVAPLPDMERSFVQMVINDVTHRAREKKQLLRSRRTLRELSASMVEAREEERQRIARELHDELGQQLTAMKLEMMACMRDHPNAALTERAQGMLDMLDETVASARRIAMDLRPLMLDDLGLADAIEWLVQEFSRRSLMVVELQLDKSLGTLPPRLSTTLYRIVQEALTNISRHAQASRVTILLEQQLQDIRLIVQDNGIGFPRVPQAHRAGSFGLLGIRERVLMLGGHLTVENAQTGGAMLTVCVPLIQAESAAETEEDTREAMDGFFEDSTRGTLE